MYRTTMLQIANHRYNERVNSANFLANGKDI